MPSDGKITKYDLQGLRRDIRTLVDRATRRGDTKAFRVVTGIVHSSALATIDAIEEQLFGEKE